MTLQQIHYVLAIAETGSMNRAAESLFISQPALTKALRELEEDFCAARIRFQDHTPAPLPANGAKPSALFQREGEELFQHQPFDAQPNHAGILPYRFFP